MFRTRFRLNEILKNRPKINNNVEVCHVDWYDFYDYLPEIDEEMMFCDEVHEVFCEYHWDPSHVLEVYPPTYVYKRNIF